jgi:transketolase
LNKQHNDLANCIRFLSIDAVQKANSGHPGMPMGMADVATVLFKNFLRFNPKNPNWLNRDRFVLSAGHGSMLLYSLLYLTGYKSITLNSIKNLDNLTQYVRDTQSIILRLVLKLPQDLLVKEFLMLLVLQLPKKF